MLGWKTINRITCLQPWLNKLSARRDGHFVISLSIPQSLGKTNGADMIPSVGRPDSGSHESNTRLESLLVS